MYTNITYNMYKLPKGKKNVNMDITGRQKIHPHHYQWEKCPEDRQHCHAECYMML